MSSDEAEVVTHVLRTSTDYYAMLKVNRTATVAEIKTSYKRMALRLHPDKNKHARAEECFKLLGKAHTTLSDEQKRAVYDRGGEAAVQQAEGGTAGRQPFAGTHFGFAPGGATFRFHTGGDDFVEDLFGMFFGGGMDPRMHQQRRAYQQQQQQARAQQQQRYQQQYYQQQQQRHRAGQHGGGSEGITSILQFLPIILFLVVAMVLQSSAFDPTPAPRGGQQQSNLNHNQHHSQHGSRGADTRHRLFTLVADEYHPHERVTTTLDEEWVFDNSIDGGQSHRERGATGSLRVSYFVNSHMFDRHLQQRRMPLRSVEEEVAKGKKESLERRCKSDQTMAMAAKKKKISSAACDELEDFAPLRL